MQIFFVTSPLPISYGFCMSLDPSNLRVSRYELSQTESVQDHVRGSRLGVTEVPALRKENIALKACRACK
jgi:hypothetical protein